MLLLFTTFLMIAGCGGDGSSGDSETGGGASAGADGLTAEQIEKGIGPVTNVDLREIDGELAERGEEIFETKCSACHKMDSRYVGPPLGTVLEQRSPEYVMNMMLNPEEMLQRHPEARAMLAEYMTPMPNQQLTENDARAVLEYFREEADDDDGHHDDQHDSNENGAGS